MSNRISIRQRVLNAVNAFRNRNEAMESKVEISEPYSSGSRAPHIYPNYNGTSKTIVSSIYTRLAMDVGNYDIKHVVLDEKGRVSKVVDDSLHQCFNLSANLDQSGLDFIRDVVISMCDEGVIAIVPIDTDIDVKAGTFKVETMRVGRIAGWMPQKVRMKVYNDLPGHGRYEELVMDKTNVAIIENPLKMVMNDQGSLLKKLVAKINSLDTVDNIALSGKLDLLMQFPFSVKSDERRKKAKSRRDELEDQLTNSPTGIAWIDSLEKVIQLNRPVTNNVLAHVQYLTQQVYSQLGITESVFNGTADADAMQNYYVRTIIPILKAITMELTRKFISPTAYSQGHRIRFFANPFSFIPPSLLADFIDKASRNEVLAGNELREGIGYLPSDDPRADELRNKNINSPDQSNDMSNKKENSSEKQPK